MDNNRITLGDIEQRLDGIDVEYRDAFPNNKFDGSAVDEKNILEHSRKRSKTDKFADKPPDAFSKDRGLLGKGVPEGSHMMPDGKVIKDSDMKGAGSGTYKEYVKHNLKQHGGDIKKCAACYRDQKGGHYAKKDGSVSEADKDKYTHTHKPKRNPQSVEPDADSDDESEVDFDEEPGQRVTRNMDPRQARRQNRGSGMDDDMDGAGFDELVGEGIIAWLRNLGHRWTGRSGGGCGRYAGRGPRRRRRNRCRERQQRVCEGCPRVVENECGHGVQGPPGSRHGCNRHHDRGRPIRVYRRRKGRRRTDANNAAADGTERQQACSGIRQQLPGIVWAHARPTLQWVCLGIMKMLPDTNVAVWRRP